MYWVILRLNSIDTTMLRRPIMSNTSRTKMAEILVKWYVLLVQWACASRSGVRYMIVSPCHETPIPSQVFCIRQLYICVICHQVNFWSPLYFSPTVSNFTRDLTPMMYRTFSTSNRSYDMYGTMYRQDTEPYEFLRSGRIWLYQVLTQWLRAWPVSSITPQWLRVWTYMYKGLVFVLQTKRKSGHLKQRYRIVRLEIPCVHFWFLLSRSPWVKPAIRVQIEENFSKMLLLVLFRGFSDIALCPRSGGWIDIGLCLLLYSLCGQWSGPIHTAVCL